MVKLSEKLIDRATIKFGKVWFNQFADILMHNADVTMIVTSHLNTYKVWVEYNEEIRRFH
jgi:hypothetical protein